MAFSSGAKSLGWAVFDEDCVLAGNARARARVFFFWGARWGGGARGEGGGGGGVGGGGAMMLCGVGGVGP